MPRARIIKPGFFKNEDLTDLPFEGRLLFAGLWTLADRDGRMEDRPKRIKMELFPADNLNIEALLDSLNARGFIHRYIAGNQMLIHLPSFSKHQHPHKNEPSSTLPACDCEALGEPAIVEDSGAEPAIGESPTDIGESEPANVGSAPAEYGIRNTEYGDGNTPSGRKAAVPPGETPVPLPKKTVVTEEWLTDERELFRERLPASGFWSFDRVLQDRMNQPYFKRATDQRAYIHGQLENAAERWAAERQTNGARNGSKHARPDEDDPILRRLQLDREREAAGGM